MKRLLLLGVMMFVVCSPLIVSYADDIYWERNPPEEPTITNKDFHLNFRTPPAKSLGDMEIYDQPKDIFEQEESATPAQSAAPTTAAVPEAPVSPTEPAIRAPMQQPHSVTRPSGERSAGAPGFTQRPTEIIPQATETGPSRSQAIVKPHQESPGTQIQPSGVNKPVPSSVEEVAKPGKKKLKWGQLDAQSAEPKTKLKWGEQ
ncbi:MAG: hypothetical protein WBG50_19225 [Desulfomonilaceae bacterium]